MAGSALRKGYLVLYNAASAVAWATILGRVASVYFAKGAPFVPLVVDDFARVTQTFAVMEIFHALTGIVPAPIFTTVMQVASRLMLVWGISYPFPHLNSSAWYTSMLTAWSTTEVIRYSYFALKQVDFIPYWLHWLRYSAFLVLYPMGISSEVAMIFKALVGPADQLATWYPYALVAVLLSYIPGSVVLYSHMLSQRRKQVGGGGAVKEKKEKKRQ
ncbi:protein tyrosine phosphatase [Neurospora intermedia]|uniref:Very-long-chain (3R)-3-hydroxyacyl-CoA dehydratase n=1 Tax=Neurospora intermedia TaxID=5142 RepID=A0ABR3DL82_NEUIN